MSSRNHTIIEENEHQATGRTYRAASFIGILLIASGAIILLDQTLKTGWLTLVILPAIGMTFLTSGVRARRPGFYIPGCILTGLGVGAFFFFTQLVDLSWTTRVGALLTLFGSGWLLIGLVSYILWRRITWWALVTGVVIAGAGLTFFTSPLRLTGFVLSIATGLGITLLAWGVVQRLFGLIIPGCLLIGIGPGVYMAWSGAGEPNGLARTGIMLVGFALGWGLITVFSRVVTQKFVWWPLIPGGVLAMVGWGLYIGGNPGNALSFIGNTGSIGLIIFGVYLLLLRRGIQG